MGEQQAAAVVLALKIEVQPHFLADSQRGQRLCLQIETQALIRERDDGAEKGRAAVHLQDRRQLEGAWR